VRIAIIPSEFHHERVFLGELANTARGLGHETVTHYPDLVIQWGAKNAPWAGPTLYAECGWLPRWWYQLSHTGINARHHLAPLELEPLDDDQRWKVGVHLERIRSGKEAPKGWGYLDIDAAPVENVPERFILAPLQMEDDVNVESMPEALRTNQGFVDQVSEHRDYYGPDLPIIFKQHPNTGAEYQLHLEMRRDGDRVYPHQHAHVYAYLKHPGCALVVTVNSNVANDALLWDVPVLTLGRGIWGPDAFRNREQYVYALMRAQWTVADARNPQRVKQAIEEAVK
jgi:hypothetical protein